MKKKIETKQNHFTELAKAPDIIESQIASITIMAKGAMEGYLSDPDIFEIMGDLLKKGAEPYKKTNKRAYFEGYSTSLAIFISQLNYEVIKDHLDKIFTDLLGMDPSQLASTAYDVDAVLLKNYTLSKALLLCNSSDKKKMHDYLNKKIHAMGQMFEGSIKLYAALNTQGIKGEELIKAIGGLIDPKDSSSTIENFAYFIQSAILLENSGFGRDLWFSGVHADYIAGAMVETINVLVEAKSKASLDMLFQAINDGKLNFAYRAKTLAKIISHLDYEKVKDYLAVILDGLLGRNLEPKAGTKVDLNHTAQNNFIFAKAMSLCLIAPQNKQMWNCLNGIITDMGKVVAGSIRLTTALISKSIGSDGIKAATEHLIDPKDSVLTKTNFTCFFRWAVRIKKEEELITEFLAWNIHPQYCFDALVSTVSFLAKEKDSDGLARLSEAVMDSYYQFNGEYLSYFVAFKLVLNKAHNKLKSLQTEKSNPENTKEKRLTLNTLSLLTKAIESTYQPNMDILRSSAFPPSSNMGNLIIISQDFLAGLYNNSPLLKEGEGFRLAVYL